MAFTVDRSDGGANEEEISEQKAADNERTTLTGGPTDARDTVEVRQRHKVTGHGSEWKMRRWAGRRAFCSRCDAGTVYFKYNVKIPQKFTSDTCIYIAGMFFFFQRRLMARFDSLVLKLVAWSFE